MQVYYASLISENMAMTPEGYLICYNVPIARLGQQQYKGKELNIEGIPPNEIVTVYRKPEDVFNPSAIASFEAKPVTNDHPPQWLTPDNFSMFMKGVATNVRRGEGEEKNKLLADLIIYDKRLIEQIQKGKRDISCGYDCINEVTQNGEICQRYIRGNHIAVVDEGRAGDHVSIKDSIEPDPEPIQEVTQITVPERRFKRMKKKNNTLVGAIAGMFPMFAQDTAPEDIVEAVETLADAITEDTAPQTDNTPQVDNSIAPQTDTETQDSELMQLVKGLVDSVEGMKSEIADMKLDQAQDTDPLKQLEDELSDESNVVIPVEEMDENGMIDNEPTQDSDAFITPPADRPVNPITDTAAILNEIRAIKPLLAGIKDERTRTQISDTMANLYRRSIGKPQQRKTGGYAAIMHTQNQHAMSQVKDSKTTISDEQLGVHIAQKYNPHYKKN